jgi:hypothetical protein
MAMTLPPSAQPYNLTINCPPLTAALKMHFFYDASEMPRLSSFKHNQDHHKSYFNCIFSPRPNEAERISTVENDYDITVSYECNGDSELTSNAPSRDQRATEDVKLRRKAQI